MSIEDVKALVKQERQTEEELRKAREEANRIIEDAKVEAKRVRDEAEDGRQYEAIFEGEMKKTEKKKRAEEKSSDEAAEKLKELGEANIEKAVGLIVKSVVGG